MWGGSWLNQFDELPEGWAAATFGDVCQVQGGFAFKSNDYQPDGVLLVRISNLVNGKVEINEKSVFLPEAFFEELSSFRLEAGDVLIAMSGATTGKMAIYNLETPALLNQRVGRFCIVAPNSVDPGFVGKLVGNVTQKVLQKAYGGAQPNISPKELEQFPIPLPPLNEQRRIVEKIEALTARSRKARATLDEIPVLLDQFRQSVLAAAFRGDLTADWRAQNPDVEPAEAFKQLYKNEIGWAVGKANDACIGVQSGSTPKGKPFTELGEVPFLKVYNIVNQEIDFNYRPQYVSREIHRTSLKRSITLPGDVLMNIVGPPLGKIALATEQFPEWNINQAIVTFRPKKGLLSKYLYYYLREGSLVRDVVNETKGIVGQVNISLTQCRESIVKIPSLDEQAEIIRRIEGLFSLAASLSDAFKSSSEDLGELDQSILAKAFRGELVPQDPNDEPAAVLLDRIRAERERLGSGKKRSKAKA